MYNLVSRLNFISLKCIFEPDIWTCDSSQILGGRCRTVISLTWATQKVEGQSEVVVRPCLKKTGRQTISEESPNMFPGFNPNTATQQNCICSFHFLNQSIFKDKPGSALNPCATWPFGCCPRSFLLFAAIEYQGTNNLHLKKKRFWLMVP